MHQRVLGASVHAHPLADRSAFALVGVQQPFGRPPPQLRGELPAEVHRVLDARVEALPAHRQVDVRRVARQEDPPRPVPVGQPGGVAEAGQPAHLGVVEQVEVGPRHAFHDRLELLQRRLHRAARRLHAELDRRDPEQARPQRDHRVHALLAQGRRHPRHHRRVGDHVRGQTVHRGRRAGEPDARQLADQARAAVAAHEVLAAHGVLAFRRPHHHRHAVRVLLRRHHLVPAPDVRAHARGAFLQQPFDVALRHQERDQRRVDQVLQLQQPEVVGLDPRVVREPVEPALAEHLDRPRVQRQRPRVLAGFRRPFQDDRRHTRQAQLTGQHQTGRPSARDDDFPAQDGPPDTCALGVDRILRGRPKGRLKPEMARSAR